MSATDTQATEPVPAVVDGQALAAITPFLATHLADSRRTQS